MSFSSRILHISRITIRVMSWIVRKIVKGGQADSGRWIAFEKGTRNEIARASSYKDLIKKTDGHKISYLKLPPAGKNVVYYN